MTAHLQSMFSNFNGLLIIFSLITLHSDLLSIDLYRFSTSSDPMLNSLTFDECLSKKVISYLHVYYGHVKFITCRLTYCKCQ